MGLALGIDYSLFVVSRYREERGRARSSTRSTRGRHREPRRAVQRHGVRGRDVRDAARAEHDHAQPRRPVRSSSASSRSSPRSTLLPALLGLLGDRVNALRLPFVGRRRSTPQAPKAASGARRALRPPAPGLSLVRRPRCSWLGRARARLDIGTSGVSRCPTASPRSRASSPSSARSRAPTRPVEIVISGNASRRRRARSGELGHARVPTTRSATARRRSERRRVGRPLGPRQRRPVATRGRRGARPARRASSRGRSPASRPRCSSRARPPRTSTTSTR